MSDTFSCHDKDALIAYLYDEADPPLRQQIEEHLRSCRECSDEVSALTMVRSELSAWTPPGIELGFALTRNADAARPVRWWTAMPAWAQAAAAVFVLGVGLGMANIQVRSGPDGLVVTTGWLSPAASASIAQSPDAQAWRPALAALESQLRGELEAARTQSPAVTAQPARVDNDAVLKRVETLLASSEQRQRQELALRLTQLTRDHDIQRRADLVRISQGFGQFEGRTGEMLARQRQLMNYITRVSGQPQQ